MDVPDYHLPPGAIAQVPAEPRDSARLLVATDPGGDLAHRHVADLPELVGPGDLLVVNNSRVLPARLMLAKATGGAAEVMLLEPIPPSDPSSTDWSALVRPGRRIPPGTVLLAGGTPLVEVGARRPDGSRQVRLLLDDDPTGAVDRASVAGVLARHGSVPLPPYIRRPLADPERYQTVYAERAGSVAAPTAGLHLTHRVLDGCRAKGAQVATVDLAVGLGTFKPVSAATAEDHLMHSEQYRVPDRTWEACVAATRVVAVGTTTVRALESAAATGQLAGATSLYVHGDYPFRVVDVLLTNFHQPRSSLLVLLESFCGPRWRELYRTALADGYRFLSLGDAMLVGRGG